MLPPKAGSKGFEGNSKLFQVESFRLWHPDRDGPRLWDTSPFRLWLWPSTDGNGCSTAPCWKSGSPGISSLKIPPGVTTNYSTSLKVPVYSFFLPKLIISLSKESYLDLHPWPKWRSRLGGIYPDKTSGHVPGTISLLPRQHPSAEHCLLCWRGRKVVAESHRCCLTRLRLPRAEVLVSRLRWLKIPWSLWKVRKGPLVPQPYSHILWLSNLTSMLNKTFKIIEVSQHK